MSEKQKGSSRIPEECLDRVREAIKRAKEEKLHAKRERRRATMRMVAVSFICLIVFIPNVSIDAAQAMSGLPVIGELFRVITFRDYHYIDDRYSADISVPELTTDDEVLSEAGDAVNEKIRAISEQWISEFEQAAAECEGRSEVFVDYEVIASAPEYFTLKLMTYQGSGSGYEKDYYFTIRIADGKEMTLAELFPEGADYVTPISENIKEQMRKQISEDNEKSYWIDLDDDDPVKAFEFDKISTEQQFYIDSQDRLVIAFDEGDAGPMYMGCVEFTIPEKVTENIK